MGWSVLSVNWEGNMRLRLAATLVASVVLSCSGAHAQQIDKKEFNVIGTWNFLTNWQKLEQPFWN